LVKESSLNAVSSVVTEQQGVPEKTAGTVKKQAAPAETDLQAKAESEKKPAEPTEAESPMAAETEKKESASCSCAAEAA